MNSGNDARFQAEDQCIDPRLLVTLQVGLQHDVDEQNLMRAEDQGSAAPRSPLDTQMLDNESGLLGEMMNTYYEPAVGSSRAGSGQLESLPVSRGLQRPQLKLNTAIECLQPVEQHETHRTPIIHITDDADRIPRFMDAESAPPQSSGRNRRNSSPARGRGRTRIFQASTRDQVHDPALLSPVTPTYMLTGASFAGARGRVEPDTDDMTIVSSPLSQRTSSVRAESPSFPYHHDFQGRFVCDEHDCPDTRNGKAFDTKNSLNKHQRKHVPYHDRKYACKACAARFYYRKDLRRHEMTHRTKDRDDPFKCGICGKVLSRDDNLNRHMRGVHGGNPSPSSSRRGSAANVLQASQHASLSPSSTPLSLAPTLAQSFALQEMMMLSDEALLHDGIFVQQPNGTRPDLHSVAMARSRTN